MNDYISPLKKGYIEKYDDKPRTDIIDLITESPGYVFEIGCGSGATGETLKQKFPNIKYIGLESEERAAQIAQSRLDRVIVADIEKVNLEDYGLVKSHFDLLICADVLEHLYDPWKTLFALRDYLKKEGKVIASIPNTQNIRLILHLLTGNWNYEKYGLLDATHIRFFTLDEIARLFSGTGYKVIHVIPKLNFKLENEGWPRDIDFGRILLKNVAKEEALRLFTFQYLIIAQNADFA